MVDSKLLVLIGGLLGLVPIALGIASLTTKEWLKLGPQISSLLICSGDMVQCPSGSTYNIAKALSIAGVCVTGIGAIVATAIGLSMNSRPLKLIPLVLLITGPILILIGLLLYAKSAFQYTLNGIFQGSGGSAPSLEIGYSLILMVVTCIVGFILAAYFAYTAGLNASPGRNNSGKQQRVFVRESVLF